MLIEPEKHQQIIDVPQKLLLTTKQKTTQCV